MKVVAIVGAAVIALAIIGLAVDVERGEPRDRVLAPLPYALNVEVDYQETFVSTGPSPGCVPSCDSVERSIHIDMRRVPDLPAVGLDAVLPGGLTLALELNDGVWSGHADLDEDLSGQPMQFRIGGQPWLDWEVDQSGPAMAPLVPGGGVVTLEQIGAVEISALIDATIDAAPPAGTQFVGWLGDTPIAFEDGVIDERIERLSIEQAFVVTLEAVGPLPDEQGLIVFQAVPIA